MSACFADTAYFIALINPIVDAHGEARSRAGVTGRRIITTSAVLNELGNHFANPPNRMVFANFAAGLRANVIP
jgi:hypothetical protein